MTELRFTDDHGNLIQLSLEFDEDSKSPTFRDARASITISFGGYSGKAHCYISEERLRSFCESAVLLELKRKGSAILESMSPGELHLEVFVCSQLGHMAVRGTVGSKTYTEGGLIPCSVSFYFRFDPHQLVELVHKQWITKFRA